MKEGGKEMKIVGFNGSPRMSGNTATILKEILKGAKDAGAEVEYIDLASLTISGCIGCERCRVDKTCTQFNDDMIPLYLLIEECDGIILGSPTYNYTMTPWIKAFIDRLYPYFDFTQERPGPYSSRLANKGKRALIFGVCEQLDEQEMQYNVPLMAKAMKVVGYEIVDTLYFTGHFKANSVSHTTKDLFKAYEAGRDFVTG